jgi:anti-sigma factor (TIGR02949 family)
MDSARDEPVDDALDPEERLLQQHTVAPVRAALEQLPVDPREVIVLRAAVSCKDVWRELDAYVDGDLDAESAMAVRDHLSGCAACRQRVAEREALGRLVRSAPHYSAPNRLRARVFE